MEIKVRQIVFLKEKWYRTVVVLSKRKEQLQPWQPNRYGHVFFKGAIQLMKTVIKKLMLLVLDGKDRSGLMFLPGQS